MKQDRPFPAVTVTKKAEASLRSGHPWVYAAEITACEGDCPSGGIVDVFSQKGAWLGAGFFSAESKIGVRILSDNANERFGPAFFERRVKYALDYRRAVMGGDFACCRLIFGEADGLPGLTVDRFSNLLSAQVLSRGTDGVKDVIYSALLAQLEAMGERIDGIYERNESPIRALEGLEQYKGWYPGAPHPESAVTEICENGVRYAVDVENGQKTGFFLDQKYNRLAVARLAPGRRVLDCFTHTGSFALNCALAGAEHVTAVDVSESAVALARQNAALNGLEGRMDFVAADVFDLLPRLAAEHADYGLVILDPPAFTKSRRTVAGAERGYHEINYRAMRLLPRGGYLATCSCSHFMPPALFEKMLRSAARDANVSLKQVEARQQAPDHPILWNVPETEYLKFYIFQVV
ncbi:MAG TPA: class I SAM-dependent rRNA methyltransferase [Candidatus Scatomorpha intestinavium]|uniref:Class I SAM-dependent rRNA methyltransferase n=1 Tax=Candidatus Scatomorpha intestinavium TaxID=2840922 RepID=A0A9D0ZE66_9FIRM|nr:class I SAM-dependent rRNA methyltransferase [Candidatus Scatomorpha intestinavium]